MIKAGDVISGRFFIHNSLGNGELVNADSLPTGAMIRNSADDGAVTVNIVNVSTGVYTFSATVPGSYAAGDTIGIQINGALAGSAFAGIVQSDVVSGDYAASAAAVWSHSPRTVTQTGEQLYNVLEGSLVTIHRGDTLELTFTGLGDISAYSKIWFTVKGPSSSIADSASDIMVRLDVSGTADGLLYAAGAAPDDVGNGSITIDDSSDGDITVNISAVETAKLTPGGNRRYDVQMLDTSDVVSTLVYGGCTIIQDVTRASS
jgi:hypothetical protein